MTINDGGANLGAMASIQTQVLQMTQNIAHVANSIGDPQFQEDTSDFIDSMVQQTPDVIAYQANAKGVETQSAMLDTLLNIKA